MTRAALAVGAVAVLALVAGGCASSPAARRSPATAKARRAPGTPARDPATARTDAAPVVPGWESFPATRAALRRDIALRAEALREGPIGGRAKQLASLRLASAGLDLAVDGALAAALDSLQKAMSLHGSNAYACVGLAYVHLVQGRTAQAAEFVASARPDLPRDASVRAEVDALSRAVAAGGV